ncbi:hypothetical protein [Candidatus Mycobacterium methanotrophicum]|uniref:Resolvase n=1 Tax=Candidatus Mycobacterium methanotrophicum TaxID=2943498 RepID=A0ABY4QTH9_9MYCO|nr:hypothetical protein [Candidatus Mycobacterium methanotrophicum]UQX13194.1 hypothetical protein M5I08_17775 [Candidatus Mycobacterium methanotrophicum]
MLLACYGPTARGKVNAAAAEYAGVTAGTVRRWIAGGKPARRRATSCPPARIARLQRGPDLAEHRNQQRHAHALAAIDSLAAGRPPQPGWRKQGWLDQHTVAIIAIHQKPWRQVVVTKANDRALAELARRGVIIDTIKTPTRFHAVALAHTVMARQQAWRVHPAADQLATGRTQVWMNDAPPVDLAALAASMRR